MLGKTARRTERAIRGRTRPICGVVNVWVWDMGRTERNAGMLKVEEEVLLESGTGGLGRRDWSVRDKIEYRIRDSLGLYMVGTSTHLSTLSRG